MRLRTILKCNQGTGRPPAVSRAVQGPAGCGRGPRDRGGIRPRASGRRHAVQRAVGVRPLRGGTATIDHPRVGPLDLHREKLPVDGLVLVIYYPDEHGVSADRLRLLAAWDGSTPESALGARD